MDGGDVAASLDEADEMTEVEVRAAIGALTSADMYRLVLVDRRYRAGTDFGEGDLLHEALCQALMRERTCKRSVRFARSIALMMRSSADHRRRKLAKQVPLDAPLSVGADGSPGLAPIDVLESDGLDPEEAMMDRQRTDAVGAMMSLFQDDEEAQLVIMGASEGLKGDALQRETGLTSNEIHYAFRKIRKRLGTDRYGWMP